MTTSRGTLWALPSPGRLAKCSEAELRALGTGYRAPLSDRDGAQRCADGFPLDAAARVWPTRRPTRGCWSCLKGVGDKVADCVLLFGCGHAVGVPGGRVGGTSCCAAGSAWHRRARRAMMERMARRALRRARRHSCSSSCSTPRARARFRWTTGSRRPAEREGRSNFRPKNAAAQNDFTAAKRLTAWFLRTKERRGRMLGVWVNFAARGAWAACSARCCAGASPERFQTGRSTRVLALCVLVIGVCGATEDLQRADRHRLGGGRARCWASGCASRTGWIGWAAGRRARFARGDGGFAAGFVNATLLFCVGAMAVVGSLEAGLCATGRTRCWPRRRMDARFGGDLRVLVRRRVWSFRPSR